MNCHGKTGVRSTTPALLLFVFSHLASGADIKGKVIVDGSRTPENIAVYVDSIPGQSFPAPKQHMILDQAHLTFIPHVLVFQKGTTVDFKNDDPVNHNIYWQNVGGNRGLAHNMGIFPPGNSQPFTFNDLGAIPLLCNVHPRMSGFILVVPTPYFAVTDKQGNFVIKHVPAGRHALKTWSSDLQLATQSVTVAGTADVRLIIHLQN